MRRMANGIQFSVTLHERDKRRLLDIANAARLTTQETMRRLIRRHYRDHFTNGPTRSMHAEDIGIGATYPSTNHHS